MKAVFGTVDLGPGGFERTSGLILNGQQINDDVQFYGSLWSLRFQRGNRSHRISFTVQRFFDTYHLAERFVLEHFSLLPSMESLYLTIGSQGDCEVVRFDGVVPDGVQLGKYTGTSVPVTYSFLVGQPVFSSPPPDVTEPGSSMIQRSTISLTSGITTLAVTFGTPFGSTPVLARPSVEIPGGGDSIDAWVVAGSTTTTGFTVNFNTAIPGTGYFLSYIASA